MEAQRQLSNLQRGFGISIDENGKGYLEGGHRSSAHASEVTLMPMHQTQVPFPETGHFKFNSKGVTKGRGSQLIQVLTRGFLWLQVHCTDKNL